MHGMGRAFTAGPHSATAPQWLREAVFAVILRIAVCAVGMLVAGSVGAASPALTLHRIRVKLPDGDASGLESLAVVCGEVVARWAPTDPQPPPWITLRITNDDVPSHDPLNLHFSALTGISVIAHGLCRALLIRACGEPSRGTLQPDALDWLAAAAAGRVIYARWDVLGQPMPDYQPLRHMFSRGAFPKVEALLMLPVAPTRAEFYQLYSLHCQLLLEAIRAEDEDPGRHLGRVLAMTARGRTAAAAVEFVLHDCFEAGEGLQAWYERRVVLVSRRGRRAASLADVKDRLHELETVPIVMPNRGAFGCVRVPIDELPETLKNYAKDTALMKGILYRCFELSKDAPEWLKDPILQYFHAFELLEKGKMFTFKRRLRQARKAFHAALARQKKLIEYVDSQELHYAGVEKILGPHLSVIRRSRDRCRRLDWRLYEYLDTFERQ